MKILYGIQATNNGHITRSLEIINKLKEYGCDVDILTSGNNSQLDIDNIKYNYHGVTFYNSYDGGIDYKKTFKHFNIIQFFKDLYNLNVDSYDLIISDFEPLTAWKGKLKNKKVIGISNQYNNYTLSGFYLSKLILNWYAPIKDKIGLAYKSDIQNNIYTPIIRNDLNKNPDSNFITVYLSQYKLSLLEHTFSKVNENFKIFSKEAKTYYKINNIEVYPISNHMFKEALENCKAIITASGFQTTSEALFLNKLLLNIPIKNQYEQLLNAKYLKKMGVYTVYNLSELDINYWLDNYKPLNIKYDNNLDDICKIILNKNDIL